jgi:hypothetical protein
MKIAKVLFGLLIAMCVVMGVAFVTGEFTSSGEPPPMLRGNSETQRDPVATGLGWCFGVLVIAILVLCLVLGIGRGRERHWIFPVGGALFVFVFSAVIVTTGSYFSEDSTSWFLSFPAPTAWMLYGVWPVPVVFMIWYSVHFDRRVLTEEDLEEFQRIVAAKRERESKEL